MRYLVALVTVLTAPYMEYVTLETMNAHAYLVSYLLISCIKLTFHLVLTTRNYKFDISVKMCLRIKTKARKFPF